MSETKTGEKLQTNSPEQMETILSFDRSIRDLVGKLLTLADATFSDVKQREAQKSVIRNLVYDWSAETHVLLFSNKSTLPEGILIYNADDFRNGADGTN